MQVLNRGAELVSVALQEVKPQDWEEKVYRPDILLQAGNLYIKRDTRCDGPKDIHDRHMVERRTTTDCYKRRLTHLAIP